MHWARLKALSVVMLSCLPFCGGCKAIESALKNMEKPTASVVGVHLDDLNLQQVTLGFDVEIKNPYGVPLPIVNVGYALASNDATFLTGAAEIQGSVPAKGSKTVRVPATVKFTELLKAVQGVRLGQVVPYAASLDLSVDAPAVGRLTLPLRKHGELPVPNIPKVELINVEWKELNIRRAQAVLSLKVENTNAFALNLTKLAYNLKLGGTAVASTGVERQVNFDKGQAGVLTIPLTLNTADLGLAAFNVLSGKQASYAIDGSMDVGTPFGPIKLPFEKKGSTLFKR